MRARSSSMRNHRAAAATVLGTMMFATLTGCGNSAPTAEAPPAQDDLEAAVRPVITEQMEEMGIPGLVAIVRSPERGDYEIAAGVANIDTGEPVEMTDHFRIGSITKTFTATVVLQLAQEGKFGLDDPLEQYFPQVDTNGATIRQALNMTSGIPTYTTDAFLNALADDPQRVWTPDELLATIEGTPAEFAPGEGWDYSNTNYVLLGMLAERFGGAPLKTLIQDRIFTPLQMNGCSLPAATDATVPAPFSHGYQYGTEWDDPSPPAPRPELVDVTNFNPSWGFGAGEAICTAADLAIWAKALVDGDLLEPEMQAQRLDFVTTGPLPYGLGIGDLNGLVGHNGHISGFQTQAAVRQADGTVIVVLTNITQAPDLQLPASMISALISGAIPASPN
ncbi:serine hydrolase domain-containing protein [Rhodococcus sp. NPDC003382]